MESGVKLNNDSMWKTVFSCVWSRSSSGVYLSQGGPERAISQGTLNRLSVIAAECDVKLADWNDKEGAFILFAFRLVTFGLLLLFYVNWFY